MLDQTIEALFKSKADEVVFIELKEGKSISHNGAVLEAGLPVPIMFKYVVDKVKGISDTDIQLRSIMEAMSYILGIDSQFPHKETYMEFMKGVDPLVTQNIIALASNAMVDEKYLDAAIFFKAAWEFDHDQPEILFRYTRCCDLAAEKGKESPQRVKLLENESYEVLMHIIEHYPDMALAYYYIGFHLVNQKSYKAAQAVWEKAVAFGIHDDAKEDILKNLTHLWSRIQYEEGYTQVLEGFPEEGLVKLLPLEDENPDWWNLMFFIGLGYRQKEDYDNAIYYFKKTLNLNTGHIDTFNEIGLCYMSKGQFTEAQEYFEEALRLSPENSELLCNLGIVFLNQGQPDQAKRLIQKAHEIDPEDSVTAAWLKYFEKTV
jgi:tetratricopeptide (TPR) repeat protein